jgi:hypothetical protein
LREGGVEKAAACEASPTPECATSGGARQSIMAAPNAAMATARETTIVE